MKHYKIFGGSLQNGIQKIGYSDVMVEIVGILVHILSVSPYAGAIKDVLSNLHAMGINNTEFPLPSFDEYDNATSLCGHHNGSDSAFNICVGELSLGTAGILIHLTQLLIVFVLLKMGKERNIDKCKLWVRMTSVLTMLDMGVLVGTLLLKPDEKIISYTLANIIYKCYSCGLITAYTTNPDPPLNPTGETNTQTGNQNSS